MENITITPEDAKDSIFTDIWDCPLARAIKRTTKCTKVHVGLNSAVIDDEWYDVRPNFGLASYHLALSGQSVTIKLTKI